MSGPGTTLLACLGAAQIDRHGNINSTVIEGAGSRGVFLVGSGGGNDVASAADEVVVMSTLTGRRAVADVPYITSVGDRVSAFVTDLGIFEKQENGELGLVAVAPGDDPIDVRVEAIRARCPWDLVVVDPLVELAPPADEDIERLRRWDPQGRFLRPDA